MGIARGTIGCSWGQFHQKYLGRDVSQQNVADFETNFDVTDDRLMVMQEVANGIEGIVTVETLTSYYDIRIAIVKEASYGSIQSILAVFFGNLTEQLAAAAPEPIELEEDTTAKVYNNFF